MFLLAGTTDAGRRRACTATAVQALRYHGAMAAAGVAPVVTDQRGRPLSLETLRSRARGEAGLIGSFATKNYPF